MTCADVRHRLLTADLSALRNAADPAIAEHLTGCATCAAAAAAIVAQTNRLGIALAQRQRTPVVRGSRWSKRVFVAIPVASAAGILLVALLTHREIDTAKPPAAGLSSETVATPRPPSAVPNSARSGSPSADKRVGREAKLAIQPRVIGTAAPTASPGAIDATSRPVNGVSVDPTLSQVRVSVGSNQRAAVIATSNPKITVVWIY